MFPAMHKIALALGLAALAASSASADSLTIDCSGGSSISLGVRGQVPARDWCRATDLTIMYNTSMRLTPAGGLEADMYDWRRLTTARYNPTNPNPSTLDCLRDLRDHNSWGIFTVNARGFGYMGTDGAWHCAIQPDGVTPDPVDGIEGMKRCAADWVRYVNRIVQLYRLKNGQIVNLSGQSVTLTGEDQRVYNSITWSPRLLTYGEAPVPTVTYWEIGNEPEFSDLAAYMIDHYMRVSATDTCLDGSGVYHPTWADNPIYWESYRDIRNAMKAMDSVTGVAIKTGPCVSDPSHWRVRPYLTAMQTNGIPMDFVSYHPYYQNLMSAWPANGTANIAALENALRDMKTTFLDAKKDAADDFSPVLLVTEYNPGKWPSYSYDLLGDSMAHALACVESVFDFAQEGVLSADYWVVPSEQKAGFKAYDKLQSLFGDRLVSSYSDGSLFRMYTLKMANGDYVVWGLNFSDSTDKVMTLSLANLPITSRSYRVTAKWQLGVSGGDTSLTSTSVDWTATQMAANPVGFTATFEDATVTAYVISAGSSPASQFTAGASTFDSGADGWGITLWRSASNAYGTMGWTAGAGNSGGAIRCCGSGSSDNGARDTREGGEIAKIISTQGLHGVKLRYDLRVGPLGLAWSGSGSNSGALDHNDLQEQLTVYYSTNAGVSWYEAGPWLGRSVLLGYQSYGSREIDFSSIPAAASNPYFALRFRWQLNNQSQSGDYADLDNIVLYGDIADSGAIRATKNLPDGTPVFLTGKVLYLKANGFGYIQEPDATSGIRLEGAIGAPEGSVVSVAGRVSTNSGHERCILATDVTALGPGSARTLGTTNRGAASPLLDGLYVRVWGKVRQGSKSADSYVVSDGSDRTGIEVMTIGAPQVAEGSYVTVTGAAGYDNCRVIYSR